MENTTQPERKWFTKKRYALPALALGGMMALGAVSDPVEQTNVVVPTIRVEQATSTKQVVSETSTTTKVVSPAEKVESKSKPTTQPSSGLSNDNYYTNSEGNTVHSPAYSDSVPVGASAQCRDGTYSFSQNRRGTCSGHGGVATWL